MATRSIDIIIGAKDRASGPIGAIAGRIRSAFGGVTKIAAGVFAGLTVDRLFRGLADGLKSVVTQSAEAEQVVSGLRAALRGIGADGDSAIADLKAFASGIQSITTHGDEAVLSVAKIGVNLGKFSGETLKSATVAAIGLAERLGVDATTAMTLLAKASAGNTATLSRYGIVLDASLTKQEKFNQLLKIGAESFGQAEAKTRTAAGAYTQLKNDIGELAEQIGDSVRGAGPGFLKGLRGLVQSAQSAFASTILPWIQNVGAAIGDGLSAAFQFAADNVLPVIASIAASIGAAFSAVGAAVGESLNLIGSVIAAGFRAIGALLDAFGVELGSLKESFQVAFITLEYAFKNWREFIELGLLKVTLGIVTFSNEVAHLFGTVVPTYLKYLADNWKQIFETVWNFTKTITTNLADNLYRFFEAVVGWLSGDEFDFTWTSLTEGFENTLAELPKIAERQRGPLEEALTGMVDDLQDGLAGSFLDFLNKRLKETERTGERLKGLFDFKPIDFKLPGAGGTVGEGEADGAGRSGGAANRRLGLPEFSGGTLAEALVAGLKASSLERAQAKPFTDERIVKSLKENTTILGRVETAIRESLSRNSGGASGQSVFGGN